MGQEQPVQSEALPRKLMEPTICYHGLAPDFYRKAVTLVLAIIGLPILNLQSEPAQNLLKR